MELNLYPAWGLLDGLAVVVGTPTLNEGESVIKKVILVKIILT